MEALRRAGGAAAIASLLACGGACGGTQPAPVEIGLPAATASGAPIAVAPPQPAPIETVAEALPPPLDAAGSFLPSRSPLEKRPPAPLARLRTEAPLLDRLLAATTPSSPDFAPLARRAGDAHLALGIASDPGELRKAMAAYEQGAKQAPNAAGADETLYALGFAAELAGDLQAARKAYFELVQRTPSSPRVPYAYFAFGELFFGEADSDPSKVPLAEAAYREVLKYPGTPILPDALWRLGLLAQKRGDAIAAQTFFARVLRDAPGSAAAGRIRSNP